MDINSSQILLNFQKIWSDIMNEKRDMNRSQSSYVEK